MKPSLFFWKDCEYSNNQHIVIIPFQTVLQEQHHPQGRAALFISGNVAFVFSHPIISPYPNFQLRILAVDIKSCNDVCIKAAYSRQVLIYRPPKQNRRDADSTQNGKRNCFKCSRRIGRLERVENHPFKCVVVYLKCCGKVVECAKEKCLDESKQNPENVFSMCIVEIDCLKRCKWR